MNLTNYSEIETAVIHSDDYKNWIFDPSHPTQGRRFINAFDQLILGLNQESHRMKVFPPRAATKKELSRVHAPSYISEVLDEHRCNEWHGPREDLSTLAALFAGGTLVALEKLLNEGFKTAIHFPGAKHHAQYDHSSGFCVFADFALAADIASRDYGLKVAIYDFDGHHGDGTENLTLENDKVLTVSVHQKGIFPGTGNASIPEKLAYNVPLVPKSTPWDDGMRDDGLGRGLGEFINRAWDFKPDLIMIAAGADGFKDDPLTDQIGLQNLLTWKKIW